MRPSSLKKFVIMLFAVCVPVLCFTSPSYDATVSDSHPGYPNAWQGLTTDSIIEINVDEPVAMVGNQPDMTYYVKMAAFSSFDLTFTDVPCDVDVSDDRLTIHIYPQSQLAQGAMYAYKILSLNFAASGTVPSYTQCFATGNDPDLVLRTTTAEADFCPELYNASLGSYCMRCHSDPGDPTNISMRIYFPTCVITP